MTRAKLVCSQVKEHDNGSTANPEKTGEQVFFNASYSDNPEDNTFAQATPSASFEMWVNNPAVWGQFEVGKEYYFDITPAT